MFFKKSYIVLFLFLLVAAAGVAQKPTDKPHSKKTSFFNNIFKRVRSSITVSRQDSANKATVINTKSVTTVETYQGKIIRSIRTEELGFERVFTDTTKRINYYGTRLLNALHVDTYDWVIRDNLFIKSGTKLNPYLIADNERYLRSLEFIQDARIVVKPIPGNPDSVDLVVVTKDLFSITGALSFNGANRQKASVAETNLFGAGQKVQLTMLHDQNRSPVMGYDFLYAKNSIGHSFIDGSIGYSRINSDRTGNDNVESFYMNLTRQLFSPYSRAAGGVQLQTNRSFNLYGQPDTIFRKYQNVSFDAWGGYNIGVKRLLEDNHDRKRTFIALRAFNNKFSQRPDQFSKGFNTLFNDMSGVLGEVTFFKQDFYKSNYIFNFGTTEDVPYGYNVAVTGGWYKQLQLGRPYFGINANRYIATDKGKFMQLFLRSGMFLNKGHLEDVSLFAGGSLYSRLYVNRHFKMRQYLRYSYTRLFNRVTYDPIQINNTYGLRYFRADTLGGTQRASLYAESFFFAKLKFFGFQLAPFTFVDATMLTGQNKAFNKSDIFTGIGGGLRTRNVNLVFGTAELRLIYFPRKAQEMESFRISFIGNIRFRYNTNYIREPSTIQLNTDDPNSFY